MAVYPAPAHVAAVPLSLLPFEAAFVLFTVLSLLAVMGSLLLVGVRDWRCYGLTLLSVSVLEALQLGGLTPFLGLALALLWRYADTTWRASFAAAALIFLKLFLWPVSLWLLMTRRGAVFFRALGLCAAVTLGAWAIIGFRGLLEYPRLLSTLATVLRGQGDSLYQGALLLGLSPTAGAIGTTAVGVVLLAAGVLLARRERAGEAFLFAVIAAFALTPVVWEQYFMLLIIPIAILQPRLGWMWAIPLLTWLAPASGFGTAVYQIAVHQAALLTLIAAALLVPAFRRRGVRSMLIAPVAARVRGPAASP
jgi:hypothetical protein